MLGLLNVGGSLKRNQRSLLAMFVTTPLMVAETQPVFASTTTYSTTATSGSYTVPAGITRVQITARGADGGLATASTAFGAGQGATVTYQINVTAGDVIRFVIGAKGANGDFESGGGGGTGVFLNGTLLIVAGGGGGEDNTGNGGGGRALTSGGTGSLAVDGAGGTGGNGGAGGGGNAGDGGGGGGGINSAGGNVNSAGGSLTTGGARADTDPITGGLGVSAGGTSNQTTDPSGADGRGAAGGSGFGGGGAGSHRESGGGGGYSGGGGGGSGGRPGGGGSYANTGATGYFSSTIAAGTDGGGTGLDGFVQIRTTTLTIVKRSVGGVGSFDFTGVNYANPVMVTTTAASPATTSSPVIGLTAFSTQTDVIESDPAPEGYTLTSINCTGLGGGAQTVTLGTTRRVRLNAAATAPGNDLICTFVNTLTGPRLTITKTADAAGPLTAGTVVTYTYTVRNEGVQTASNVSINDVHNGTGTLPVPGSEALVTDATPTGDTTDTNPAGGIWGALGRGDTIRFTSSYTVLQSDIDNLQ
jgi:uncharacterized repeat protein (TIGR01451 family)